MSGFFVSRQRDYKDNVLYVECAVGGKAHAGPDILTPRHEKECKTYTNPVDAVNIAVSIFRKWEASSSDERKMFRIVEKDKVIVFDFSERGIEAALKWANNIVGKMSKCGCCTKILGNRDTYQIDDLQNAAFCSEFCVAKKYRDMFGVELPRVLSNKQKKLSAAAPKGP